ncbi:MAG: hypothetical protein JSW26_22925 [Desulfobacterales bacterium]|nr:MAG: hypothetical protein JSW26_22925 [Desulfobacterales bacterium]
MQNVIPLIFIGFFIYLIFSRKGGMGGMGCCGGHGGHEDQGSHRDRSSDKEKKVNSEPVSQTQDEKVIDLLEGKDYVLIPVKDDSRRIR